MDLERQVFEVRPLVGVLTRLRCLPRRAARCRSLARRRSAPEVAAARPAASGLVVRARAHELDVAGHHFEAGPDLALLVRPGTRFEAALDVDPAALLEVGLEGFGALAEDGDADPLGLVLPLALSGARSIVRGHVEAQKRRASRRVPHLRVAA